jgi:hypothetical protein
MKRFLPFFALLVFALAQGSAQDNNLFTVRVGTFIDAKADDFKPLQAIGFLYAQEVGGNLRDVFLGSFSSRADAERAAQEVRQRGYSSAFIQERRAREGQIATIIQLATRRADSKLEWEKFMEAGEIFAMPDGNLIKIATGAYPDTEAAQQDLPRIRRLGFRDAFVKNVSTIELIPLTEFETGIKKDLARAAAAPRPASTTTARSGAPASTPPTYEVLIPRTPDLATPPESVAEVPPSYDYVPPVIATPTLAAAPRAVAMPAINSRLKRTSALELQKILKAENVYPGLLDGYYGSGTATGYEKLLQQNRTIRKYQLIAETMPLPGQEGKPESELQRLVNAIGANPSAAGQLSSFQEPIAQAYQAYQRFASQGASAEVNRLMNAAIREAFGSRSVAGLPFDPKATYAYQEIGQLVVHLHYLHCATAAPIAAPCWLFDRHPQEANRAYQACAAAPSANVKIPACGQFENWPEVKALVAIAADLNSDQVFNQQRLSQAATERSRLYMAPSALNASEQKAVEGWSNNLLEGLRAWAGRDPLNQQMATAFQAMFFQSQVRLEDYFMSKGYNAAQATGLALATLHTLVAYHTQRFV